MTNVSLKSTLVLYLQEIMQQSGNLRVSWTADKNTTVLDT